MVLRMQEGTKHGGIHCIQMSTSVEEIETESGVIHEGLIELNLSTSHAFELLEQLYAGWEMIDRQWSERRVNETKDGKSIIFKGNLLTWAVRKLG
ncbi:hypothetical protein [Paenibacillus gorillae]|uniref:hypothetical protein n=1 Tax=Paenibacillus gorillae TaxID=1243662 RepID=UPI001EE1C051|nr:hypothetical protein [Paenibacillus gorillae]